MISHLLLEPRDGWFVQTAAGWRPNGAGVSKSHVWPPPPTLTGAIRTAWGRGQAGSEAWKPEQWAAALQVSLGATVALRYPITGAQAGAPKAEHRLWRVPQDAVFLADATVRKDPQPAAGVVLGAADDAAADSLWLAEVTSKAKPIKAPQWWTEAELVHWLTQRDLVKHPNSKPADPRTPIRPETHVSINPETYTALDTHLYANEVVEAFDHVDGGTNQWAIAATIDHPTEGISATLGLGNDRRTLRKRSASKDLFAAPEAFKSATTTTYIRVIAATATEFAAGWLPDGFAIDGSGNVRGSLFGHPATLRSALIERPQHLSGWDMAKGAPKAVRRLCPAGSVWFFELDEAIDSARMAALWLQAWGTGTDEGLGRVLVAPWFHN